MWFSMEFPTAPVNESLEEFKKLKAEELNNILRDRGQPVTGKKADLVLRHHVLFSWKAKKLTNVLPEQENVTFLAVTSSKKNADLTYEYCGWGAGIVHGLLTNEDYHPSTLCSCGVWFISCYKEQNTISFSSHVRMGFLSLSLAISITTKSKVKCMSAI